MKPVIGFVALLDVLGFSSLVGSESNKEQLEDYLQAVSEATAGKGDIRRVQFVLFSDSIVVTTTDDELVSLRILIRACSRTIGLLQEKRIAIRGAIAHGLFFRESSDNGVFVAGRPIIEAYDFERRQDWVGVMLCPSVIRAHAGIPEMCSWPFDVNNLCLPNRWPGFLSVRRHTGIPFHQSNQFEDHHYDGFALAPTPSGSATVDVAPYLIRCTESLDVLKSYAPDPAAQRKYAVTIQWLTSWRTEIERAVKMQGVPTEVEWY